MSFPSSPAVGQQHTEGGRLYQWTSLNTWDLVANVTGHAATHAANGADPLALSASQISGLPTAGTGSSNYCAGDDARLSNSRTPTSHAASHAASGSDPLTLTSSQISDFATAVAAASPAPIHPFLLMGG
jgi:hypothetical protein